VSPFTGRPRAFVRVAGASPALVVAKEPNDDTGPLFAIVAL